MPRDYDHIARRAKNECRGDRPQRMRTLVDILWDALHHEGVSWVGFYLPMTEDDRRANSAWEGDGMILHAHRDNPACSPIGMHGACGQAFTARRTLVVRDVKDLGAGYVACDPRDRSELVIPCLEDSGKAWGVLDFDSWDVGAFNDDDAQGVRRALEIAGLTSGPPPACGRG